MFKGVFFNLTRTVLEEEISASVWNQIRNFRGLRAQYEDLANYTWDEWSALVEGTGEVLNRSRRKTFRWLGKKWIPELKRRHPWLYHDYESFQELLEDIPLRILPRLKKQYPGIQFPDLQVLTDDEGQLSVRFPSRDDLCALVEGLLEGTASLYSTPVTLNQPRCVTRGDDACQIRLNLDSQ